jgi:hypothetical protein
LLLLLLFLGLLLVRGRCLQVDVVRGCLLALLQRQQQRSLHIGRLVTRECLAFLLCLQSDGLLPHSLAAARCWSVGLSVQ